MRTLLFYIFTVISFCFAPATWAQESSKPEDGGGCQMEISSEELQSITSGKQYYKVFKVDGKDGRVTLLEFNLVMREGQTYYFNIRSAHAGANGIVMKVYERKGKNRILTNFSGSGISANTSYKCPKTGMYDVKFTFRGSKDYCGVCVCSYTE